MNCCHRDIVIQSLNTFSLPLSSLFHSLKILNFDNLGPVAQKLVNA